MQIQANGEKAELVLRALVALAPESFSEVTPVFKSRWEELVHVIKNSNMTDAMAVACLAQAALESGWGESLVSKSCLNFWGIKFRPELAEIATAKEVKVTSETEGKALFANFPSVELAVKGWRLFLTRPYYIGWEEHMYDSEEFMRHIGKNWCPAKGYAEKVIALFPKARELLDL